MCLMLRLQYNKGRSWLYFMENNAIYYNMFISYIIIMKQWTAKLSEFKALLCKMGEICSLFIGNRM